MTFTPAHTEQVRRIGELLAVPRRTAVLAHVNPDGDAIGSSLGWMHVLRAMGHAVQVVMPNTAAAGLRWMPGFPAIIAFDERPDEARAALRGCELLFCLDFNRTDRADRLEPDLKAAPLRVLIDHHREPEDFAEVALSDPSAPSTALMVHDLAVALGAGGHIGADAATCLLAGIVADTGSFRYRSTTPHALRVAAGLLERGAELDRITRSIEGERSEDALRLQGYALSEKLTVLPELGAAIIALDRAELQRFRHQPGDTEGLVNLGLSIAGVRLSAFLAEREDHIKLSLRSLGTLPVDGLMREHFGGGGHVNAAGGRHHGSMEDAVRKLCALLPALMHQHPA